LSIPGTGLYNREVIRGTQGHDTPQEPAPLIGGILDRVLLVACALIVLFILAVTYSLAPGLGILLVIVLVVGAIRGVVKRAQSREAVAAVPEVPHTNTLMPFIKTGQDLSTPPEEVPSQSAGAIPQLPADLNTDVVALAASIKGFVARIEPPLKDAMRSYRTAGLASSLLELDIERMIMRTGFDGTQLSLWSARQILYQGA